MKIAEAAAHSGLPVSTIRFYEKSGLCPGISRGADGNRQFSNKDADWLRLLASLRETGMPLSRMRAFAALYASGGDTLRQRKATLLDHRESLKERQAELDRCRAILEHKLGTYDQLLEGQG